MPRVLRACLNSESALVFRVESRGEQTTELWRYGSAAFPG
jgi:hypothetical protein